jgi:hypothetical protein
MIAPDQSRVAAFLLRVIVDQDVVPDDRTDWSGLLGVAQSNGVLIRAMERLDQLGAEPPPFVAEAVARERQRAATIRELMRTVDATLTAHGVAHVFLTRLDRHPDAGRDVDVLLLDRAPNADAELLDGLRATPLPRQVVDRIAGAARYQIAGCELDLHHGRLGAVGEDTACARLLVRRARRRRVDDVEFFAPSPEDFMVLQGMRRVYARRGIRLADVVSTIRAVRRDGLDWDEVGATADRCGVLAGLHCYLGYVEQIHRAVFTAPLLPTALVRAFHLGGWGRVVFRNGSYRFPTLRVGGWLYLCKLGIKLARGSWDAAGRLCLIPLLGAAAGMRRMARP